MRAWSALRAACQTLISVCKVVASGTRGLRHWRFSSKSSISALFNQLACLGVWINSSRSRMRLASGGCEGFVEAGRVVGVEVVEHHADGGGLGEVVVHQKEHLPGEVHARTPGGDVDLPPTQTRGYQHKDVRRTATLVLVVEAFQLPGRGGSGARASAISCLLVSSKQT